MTDIGSVQVLSNAAPGNTVQNSNLPGLQARVQAAESEGRRETNSRTVAFTAKFNDLDGDTGFRIVRGDEVAAIESADLSALLDIRLSQAAAQALISLQEVQDNGDAPAESNTEAIPTGPVQIDTTNTDGTTASLDVETPATVSAEIEVQGTGDTTAETSTGIDASAPANIGDDTTNIGITLSDGTVTAGGTGGPPRGAVLDIIV
ncbi:hypothetical protein N9452_06165 [Alphaproteobacteria bacterium]|nr:hypothetical protein [Alphaproteobacteria bacterium]